jgi:hypothetical protein
MAVAAMHSRCRSWVKNRLYRCGLLVRLFQNLTHAVQQKRPLIAAATASHVRRTAAARFSELDVVRVLARRPQPVA